MKSLQSQSSSLPPLLDSDIQFGSLENSMETQLKVLEIKETRLNNRANELELREKEMDLVRERLELRERMLELKEKSFEDFDIAKAGKESIVLSEMESGQNLLMILNDQVGGIEKLCDRVYHVLEMVDDPAKWVLDVVKEFYLENEERGVLESVWKRSCVILLEQLMRLRPNVVPLVKAEAARLASEWRMKIKAEDDQKGILEVWGFLLLLGAYGLVDEFDTGEIFSMFEFIMKKQRRADELLSEFGLADKEPDLQLDNPVTSPSVCPGDALKSFCVGMDGKGLRLFLYEHIDVHDSMCDEVRDALSHAPDPAKLVLDAIPCYLRVHPEFDKRLLLSKVRKICIILLEQLIAISPPISPHVEEEALKMADEWRANLGEKFHRPVVVYGFLLFVAAYGLTSNYHADELLDHFGTANQYKASPELCQVLGLADKVEVLIRTLIQKTMLLEAIDNIYAYKLVPKFQPVRLLKGYLKFNKKMLSRKANKSILQQTQAIDKEIAVLRTIIKYVSKYKLESEYSPVGLEKQISKLEEQKMRLYATPVTPQTKKKKADMKPNVIIPSPACGSNFLDSEEKIDSPLKEDVQLENQMASVPTSPWPKLETFCVSNDGIGLKFFSNEYVEEQVSTSNSSTDPWPELKTFCVSMDGRSLRLFLCDHVEEHDSMCDEVRDALLDAPDPEKLVLDAIAGFLRLQPLFDKSISLSKVRKSCILLLEQLITICPQISPAVKEEASRMEDEWRANLGEKYQNPVTVYGFLHFVAAYGFTSNYEADELLVLLATANQYKVCPGLCQILGLADKVSVLIENLKQKNLLLEAIEHIYAFEVADKYKPVHLLKGYLTYSMKAIYKKGNKSLTRQDQARAIDKEIAVLSTVMSYITKYNLESEYPPEELEKDILEFGKQKALYK
ncbi:hypothetical protein UlMin_029368 [Ulmus minor]